MKLQLVEPPQHYESHSVKAHNTLRHDYTIGTLDRQKACNTCADKLRVRHKIGYVEYSETETV